MFIVKWRTFVPAQEMKACVVVVLGEGVVVELYIHSFLTLEVNEDESTTYRFSLSIDALGWLT